MNNKASSKLLLKNMMWNCSKCKRVLAAGKFAVHVTKLDEWYNEYFNHVLAPGYLLRCSSCAGVQNQTGATVCMPDLLRN